MSLDVVFVDATGVPVMEASFLMPAERMVAVPPPNIAGELSLDFQARPISMEFTPSPVDSVDVSPVTGEGVGKTLTLEFTVPTFEAEVSPIYTGQSAYDVAVVNGFQGTQQEWLESLRNDANIVGTPVTDADVVEDWDAA